jgi:predicted DNA-binding protein YlxM (UPF0122 family)
MKKLFFLNDEIHQRLVEIPSENVIVAWSFPQEKRIWYDRSYVRREYGNVYSLKEVSELLNESEVAIFDYIKRGIISRPFKIYNIETKRPLRFLWSEKEILDIRDKLYDLAPKNKYGEPFKLKLISKGELLSKMRKDNSYYIKGEDGSFVKVWKNI